MNESEQTQEIPQQDAPATESAPAEEPTTEAPAEQQASDASDK